MPPLPLTNLLQGALPHLSATTRAVMSTLGCRNGHAPSAGEVAAWVGLRDRHQLARSLRRDGLPPFERLASWARVLYWMLDAQSSNSSLLRLARREQLDPASAYRLVQRVTGQRWSEARQAGLESALARFRDECGGRDLGAPGRADEPERRQGAAGGPPRGAGSSAGRWPVAGRAIPRHPGGILAGRLAMSGNPFDVVVGRDGTACVTRCHAGAIACLELAPLRVVASVVTGAVPTRVVLSPSGHEAYVTNQFTEDVAIIDLSRCLRAGAVAVAGHPLGAVLSEDGRTLYVATNLDRLCTISIPARRVVASATVPPVCADLALHPSGRWVYVPTRTPGIVQEVDARTLKATRQFSVGGTPQDLIVSADGLLLYVANQQGWLDAIQLSLGRLVARVHFGTAAFGVALSPDDAVLYVSLQHGGRVVALDRPTLRALGSVETGGRPRRVAFDPAGHCALIANEAGWVDLVR